MPNDKHIIRQSLTDPDQGRTDWDRVRALTDADIAASVENDEDAAPLLDPAWIEAATKKQPSKIQLTVRLDQDVVDFFKAQGPKYQTRMNTVLRAFMEHRRRTG